jgi:hypothetical protein
MKATREQLELAAKAAGYKLFFHERAGYAPQPSIGGKVWNPVADKSDSFDLMVACKISLLWGDGIVRADSHRGIDTFAFYKDHNNDKGLATMAAVFLCAVAIGEAMVDGRSNK